MQRIHWCGELELGHAEIDAQHRRMVEIFNALHAAVDENRAGEAENRLLDEMVQVAEENFRGEERLMRARANSRADWAERFAAHRDAHEHLLYEIVRLRDTLFERRGLIRGESGTRSGTRRRAVFPVSGTRRAR